MRRKFSGLFVLLLAGAIHAQSFTLEQIMSAPFPFDLAAAPKGGKAAWVLNDQGVRNIWVAEAPKYEGRAITAYTEDDGQAVSSLSWTPGGEWIVYVRGGGPNRLGGYPNPLSDPEGVEQALWMIPARGGEPLRLGEGSAPAASPKGDGIAFIKKGQIWWAPFDTSEKALQLVKARGSSWSLRWSPDGSQLAFVNGRASHSYIGIYTLETRKVRYMAPSVDVDGRPVWFPDGRRIAFIRIPADRQRVPFTPQRTAQPWSIWVADAATGEGRMVWQANEGPGSAFRGIVARNQLFWAAGDRLVFPWECDGWTHLYSVPVKGGKALLLTPGEFEVEHVSISSDGKEMIYSSNQGDIDRRHVWRVPAKGGKPRQVTSGKGIEWSPRMAGDGQALVFLRSTATRPAHAAVIVGRGKPRELAPGTIPAGFPTRELVEPQQVIFSAADGMRIHGQLFLPKNTRPPTLRSGPAVLFLHGGPQRQMLLGWHYGGYYHKAYALNQYLASRGYVVLSVNFRSGIGYGLEFREALNYGAQGASEFNDVLGAGLYLRSRPDVDPDRIGLWGGSYGGYLTALGLARASDLFAAGVDLHGVHDWNLVIPNFAPGYDPLKRPELARLAFESSPMAYIEDWRSPVLVIHGDDDRNVPFTETVDLVESLRRQGVEVEQLIFPDEVHSFLLHRRWLEAYHAAADFFARHLGGKP